MIKLFYRKYLWEFLYIFGLMTCDELQKLIADRYRIDSDLAEEIAYQLLVDDTINLNLDRITKEQVENLLNIINDNC